MRWTIGPVTKEDDAKRGNTAGKPIKLVMYGDDTDGKRWPVETRHYFDTQAEALNAVGKGTA